MRELGCERTVLIVEDDQDVRESIEEVLTLNGYQTLCAENGKEALDRARLSAKKPCVILLDVMMPVMDGWQFRAIQRSDAELGQIPVVVLTAHANAKEAATKMETAGWLRKPVAMRDLLSMVRRFCE